MKPYQVKDISTAVEDIDMQSRKVKAVWARTGNIDLDNDIILPTAFTKTIAERGPKGKNVVWSLVDHKSSMKYALGKPEELYMDGDMLVAITPIIETEIGEDILKLYEAGLINQHSIGFSTVKSEFNNDSGIRTITELMLYEGSAVLWAANPETPTLEVFKGNVEDLKEHLSVRLDKLCSAVKHGKFTDETFGILEIEIKQIQDAILQITTQAAAKALEPEVNYASLFEGLKSINHQLKRVK